MKEERKKTREDIREIEGFKKGLRGKNYGRKGQRETTVT
jgi:hypothetical protein